MIDSILLSFNFNDDESRYRQIGRRRQTIDSNVCMGIHLRKSAINILENSLEFDPFLSTSHADRRFTLPVIPDFTVRAVEARSNANSVVRVALAVRPVNYLNH